VGPAPSWASTDLEPTASPSGPVPLPAPSPTPLRCVNGDPPQTWTRIDAEAAYHTAAMHLRTAEAAGLWNDRGQRAVRLATAQLLEVLVCWSPGTVPP
jgi:hypothetical protein